MNAAMQRLKRTTLLTFAAILSVVGTAWAMVPPEQVIESTTSAIRQDISQNVQTYQTDKNAFYTMVDAAIVPHFDTTYIAKVILGAHLKDASPEQIGQFEKAFKDMLVHSYADKLLEYYDSVEIEVKPARIDGSGKKASVDTTIVRKDGKPPIPVTFSMRKVDDEWKVWDIKAENISLVLNFRTQLDGEIRKTSVADVIQRLNANQLSVSTEGVADPAVTPGS
jgi:phospholipid transport system substrate-binding protein